MYAKDVESSKEVIIDVKSAAHIIAMSIAALKYSDTIISAMHELAKEFGVSRGRSTKVHEAVRVGMYVSLLLSLHSLLYGDPSLLRPIPTHSAIPERVNVKGESVYLGIDLALLFHYPFGRKRVWIPLFIACRRDQESLKRECPNINKIVSYVSSSVTSSHVKFLLKRLELFIRAAILDVNLDEYRQNYEDLRRFCCTAYSDATIPTYRDFVRSIICPMFEIVDLYNMVTHDDHLSRASLEDWLEILVVLSIPYIVVESERPPGSGGISALQRLYEAIRANLSEADNASGLEYYIRRSLHKVLERLTQHSSTEEKLLEHSL